MAKAELKTKVNDASVTKFLNSVTDEQKRNDCLELLKLMQQVTKEAPKMWGASIVGFGSYHYKGKSGREGDWMLIGFSPRKQNLTLYLMGGFDTHTDLLKKLGKFTTSVGCLYIKKLDDVDKKVLKALVQASVKRMKQLSR
jgi:nucleoid DNA-binding protein